jgi:hypothetical protein
MTACPSGDQLRAAGIWTEDGQTAGVCEGPQYELAFWSDVSVALGVFELRHPEGK